MRDQTAFLKMCKFSKRYMSFWLLGLLFCLWPLSGIFAQSSQETLEKADVTEEKPLKNQEVTKAAQAEQPVPHFEAAPALPRFDAIVGQHVIWVPIEDEIELGLAVFVERVLAEATHATAVVFDINTLGGRIDAAIKIRDAILNCKTPTFAYVHRRAIRAGALIALATDHIVFAPGGSLGAATPIQTDGEKAGPVGEKTVSYMRAEMRATAESKGRSGAMAEAMVDASLVFEPYAPQGKLLTLSAEDARAVGLTGASQDSQAGLLAALGLEHAVLEVAQPTMGEKISRFLTDTRVSGILMSLGMLGLIVEFWTPGFGLPGIAGLLCLACFFWGHMVSSIASFTEVGLFALGLVLLMVEMFVIPGFGIVGILGFIAVILSLALTMVGMPLDVAWSSGALLNAIGVVLISIVVAVVILFFLMKKLPKLKFASKLVLNTQLSVHGPSVQGPEGEASVQAAPEEWAQYLGQTGVVVSDLRMAGKARFGDQVMDVVSQSEYISEGEKVRVVLVEGVRIVVVKEQN